MVQTSTVIEICMTISPRFFAITGFRSPLNGWRCCVRFQVARTARTADEVAEHVRPEIGSISRQAAYDALGMLSEKGIIRRIQPAGSPARYEDRVGDNHHHLICRTCGRMVDVDCAIGAAPCLTAADTSGYQIDEAEVIYWGTCPRCLKATKRSARH